MCTLYPVSDLYSSSAHGVLLPPSPLIDHNTAIVVPAQVGDWDPLFPICEHRFPFLFWEQRWRGPIDSCTAISTAAAESLVVEGV